MKDDKKGKKTKGDVTSEDDNDKRTKRKRTNKK